MRYVTLVGEMDVTRPWITMFRRSGGSLSLECEVPFGVEFEGLVVPLNC